VACDDTTPAPVTYTCAQGLAQYALTDCPGLYPNLTIETNTGSPGSDCGHWAEAYYDTELMTPVRLALPLAASLIAQLNQHPRKHINTV